MVPKSDTKERILGTAFQLFSQKGYSKVSMNEIARESGVSKGGLFHHFSSKYVLGREVLFFFSSNMITDLLPPEKLTEMPPNDQLKMFIDLLVDVVVTDVNWARFFFDIYSEALELGHEIDVWLDFMNQYVGFIQGIFERMGEKNPRTRSLIFLSAFDGFTLYYEFLHKAGQKVDLEELREELYGLFLNGTSSGGD